MRFTSNQMRLTVFRFVTEENAAAYRTIAQVFATEKHNFRLYLRPADIAKSLETSGLYLTDTPLQTALTQLCEWGILEAHPDTAEVATVGR